MLKTDRSEENYPKTIHNVLPKLESLGFEDFKSEIPEHAAPAGFSMTGENSVHFVPDIVANRNGKKAYIEISRKTEKVNKLVSKWKLLSTAANMKGGIFGIVAPRGTVKFTKELLADHRIEASLIRL